MNAFRIGSIAHAADCLEGARRILRPGGLLDEDDKRVLNPQTVSRIDEVCHRLARSLPPEVEEIRRLVDELRSARENGLCLPKAQR